MARDNAVVRQELIKASDATIDDAVGHADPEIDDAVRAEFERRAARNDLPFAEFKRREGIRLNADLAGKRGVVWGCEGLPVVLGPRHDHAIHQNTRNLDLTWVEAAGFGYPLDLRNDNAAGIACRHGNRQRFQRQRLFLHGQVAIGIGCRGTDDADMDREGLIGEAFFATERDPLDQFLGGSRVELAAAVERVNEGVHSHGRDMRRPMRGNIAEEVGDHPLRQVIGLDMIADRELLERRHETPMPANHSLDHADVTEVIEALVLAVPLSCRIDQRQISGVSLCQRVIAAAVEKPFFECDGDFLGKADADKAASGDSVAIADQCHSLFCRHDLALRGIPDQRHRGVCRHEALSVF